jgi:hypothetical protein
MQISYLVTPARAKNRGASADAQKLCCKSVARETCVQKHQPWLVSILLEVPMIAVPLWHLPSMTQPTEVAFAHGQSAMTSASPFLRAICHLVIHGDKWLLMGS